MHLQSNLRKCALHVVAHIYINIQRVNVKFNEFQAFIDRINVKNPINVICLQECWLKNYDNVTMFNLTGYEMVYKTRSCCAHGGLIIYIHNELECITLTDINIASTGWEYLCVELCDRKPRSKKIHTMQYVQNSK